MHTAPEPRRDRLEDRRASVSALAERFSPDEHEGSRERRGVIGIEILIEAALPRVERVRAHPDANAPILTP
jgi:hypothetical protein